jgi:hypothetical protein
LTSRAAKSFHDPSPPDLEKRFPRRLALGSPGRKRSLRASRPGRGARKRVRESIRGTSWLRPLTAGTRTPSFTLLGVRSWYVPGGSAGWVPGGGVVPAPLVEEAYQPAAARVRRSAVFLVRALGQPSAHHAPLHCAGWRGRTAVGATGARPGARANRHHGCGVRAAGGATTSPLAHISARDAPGSARNLPETRQTLPRG